MTRERTQDLARRLRSACEQAPQNGVPPKGITAVDVARIADAFESFDFLVQHLYRERVRIIRLLGLQVEGPDACQDGYPDLAHILAEFIDEKRRELAVAVQRAWQAEQRAGGAAC